MDDNCGEWVECMCVASGCGKFMYKTVCAAFIWMPGSPVVAGMFILRGKKI